MKVFRVPSKVFQWRVKSNSTEGKYYIVSWDDRWHCNCIGFATHKKECRHIRIAKNYFKGLNYEENYK